MLGERKRSKHMLISSISKTIFSSRRSKGTCLSKSLLAVIGLQSSLLMGSGVDPAVLESLAHSVKYADPQKQMNVSVSDYLKDRTSVSELIEISDGVSYVRIGSFDQDTAKEFESILSQSPPECLIVDLRGNRGGVMDSALAIVDLFLPEDSLMVKVRRLKTNKYEFLRTENDARFANIELVFLVDRHTASASEMLAGSLRAEKGAILIGEKTTGKGSVQSILALADGHMAKLTTGEFFLSNGRRVEGMGLEPDIVVKHSKRKARFSKASVTKSDSGISAALHYITRAH